MRRHLSSGGKSSLWVAREKEEPAEVAAGVEYRDELFTAAGGFDGFFLVREESGSGEIYGVLSGRAERITADGVIKRSWA